MIEGIDDEFDALAGHLHDGLDWLNQQFGKNVKHVKRQLKKKGVDLEQLEQNVRDLARHVNQGIKSYVALVEGKERFLDEDVAKEFHDIFHKIRNDIQKILRDPSKILTDTNEVLKELSHTIIKAFSALQSIFKSVFSQEAKKPVLTPGHHGQKPPQHLKRDDAMEREQRNTHHTPTNSRNTRLGTKGKGKG